MSRDVALRAPSEASTSQDSSHSHKTGYNNEEDHRRLLFGLMRAGLTPQVELALRLLDEQRSEYSDDDDIDEDEEDNDSVDYDYDSDVGAAEDEPEESCESGEDGEDSPSLTTKPLGYSLKSVRVAPNDDERAVDRVGRGWAWAKNDDQQLDHLRHREEYGYVNKWLADVNTSKVVV